MYNHMIPVSLKQELANKLTEIVLDTDKGEISAETAKKIIFLWRQDALASDKGLEVLLETSYSMSPEKTSNILEFLGIKPELVIPNFF